MRRVGVTGHQDLGGPASAAWTRAALRAAAADLSPCIAVSSLAAGADQVFARAALTFGGSLEAVLPFAEYELVLDRGSRRAFRDLIAAAESVEILPEHDSREESYWAAGRRVVDRSDTVVAVWNGLPARGLGGTADVVQYVRSLGRPLVLIDTTQQTTSVERMKPDAG